MTIILVAALHLQMSACVHAVSGADLGVDLSQPVTDNREDEQDRSYERCDQEPSHSNSPSKEGRPLMLLAPATPLLMYRARTRPLPLPAGTVNLASIGSLDSGITGRGACERHTA